MEHYIDLQSRHVAKRDTVEVRQPVNAVYYRNTALSSRITAFLDFIAERLQHDRQPATNR